MIDFSAAFLTLETEDDRYFAEQLFLMYQNAMYQEAYRILKSNEDAEDAVMQAAETICRNVELYKKLPERERKYHLLVCVRNAAIDIYRKKQKHHTISIDEILFGYSEPEQDGIAVSDEPVFDGDIFTENHDCIKNCICILTEEEKAIVLMYYVENMSYRQIAKLLQISENNVAVKMYRIKKKLKDELQKEIRK